LTDFWLSDQEIGDTGVRGALASIGI